MKLRHLMIVASLLAPLAAAEEVVFYRCTDAAGGLTLQNMPCPKGSKQEAKVMQGVSSMPAPAPGTARLNPPASAAIAPASPAPATVPDPTAGVPQKADTAADPADPIDSAELLPPPVLFQCTTYNKDTYITESAESQSRCVALRTVGLDGNPMTGAGEACEVVQDLCARVPDEALCDAWQKRHGEAEVAWRFTRAETEQKNKDEFERVQRILAGSNCAGR